MFNNNTKIIKLFIKNGYYTYEDLSSILLNENNSEAIKCTEQATLYIGFPEIFYHIYPIVFSTYNSITSITLRYYKNSTPPDWYTINNITDTTNKLNNSGYIRWNQNSVTSWGKSTVYIYDNLFWISLNFTGGNIYIKNLFNYLDIIKNITLDNSPKLNILSHYIITFRPNKNLLEV